MKALYRLTCESGNKSETGTNELAAHLNVKPATASDMLRKLKAKKLISYERYGKSSLTRKGNQLATDIVRKHRLWETFLSEKLGFSWDEVHEVAEQLEHIQSPKLVERLNKFLGYPTQDPHGDLIPQNNHSEALPQRPTLAEAGAGNSFAVVGVSNNTPEFLQYLDKIGISLRTVIRVLHRHTFDQTTEVEVDGKKISISDKASQNILVEPV